LLLRLSVDENRFSQIVLHGEGGDTFLIKVVVMHKEYESVLYICFLLITTDLCNIVQYYDI